jgi:GNAT superfamily N-acetyltransferase
MRRPHATIRLGRPDEIAAIYAVHRDSVAALCYGHYTPRQIEMWLDGRRPEMYLDAIDEGRLWVALDPGGAITGFVEIAGREVSKLFVRGESAGDGVGGRLLAAAIAAIRSAGAASVYLEATRNAREFYCRHGFIEIGTGLFSRGESGVGLEIIMMELDLTRSS